MKREILFRGKRVDNGEWVQGDLINGMGSKAGKMYILPHVANVAKLSGCDPIDGYEVNPDTVGQFTGLLDKNGNRIFEGDVLKWKCSKSGSSKEKMYVVTLEWEKGAHKYSLTIHDGGEKWATSKSYWNASEREIIGNIYDHPELTQ